MADQIKSLLDAARSLRSGLSLPTDPSFVWAPLSPSAVPKEQLCTKCRAMFTSAGLRAMHSKQGYIHFTDPREYGKAAESGCSICQIVWESARSHLPVAFFAEGGGTVTESKEVSTSASSFVVQGLDTLRPVHISIQDGSIRYGASYCNIKLFTLPNDPLAQYLSARPVATKVAGQTVRETSKLWLENCRSNHAVCREGVGNMLPMRLLNATSMKDPGVLELSPTDPHIRYDYVALSYCWGGDQSVKLTEAKLETMRQTGDYGIPLTMLPATIQDAVEVTRSLGLQYLWVDALCIIQDSEIDKLAEIKRMGDIYSNATVTLMASVAKSVRDGFLRVPRAHPASFKTPIELPDGAAGDLYISKVIDFGIDHLPLNSRGWAFQESILSSRHLVYSEHEVLWRCRSEHIKTVTNGAISYSGEGFRLDQMPPHQLAALSSDERRQLWGHVVEEFTGRLLTDPNDRVHAIAGVAKVFADAWNESFLFGLMASCLPQQLCWQVNGAPAGRTLPRQPRSDRAPSWSWQSLDSAIVAETMSIRTYDKSDVVHLQPGSRELIVNGLLAPHTTDFVSIKLDHPVFCSEEDRNMEKYVFLLGYNTLAEMPFGYCGLFLGNTGDNKYKRFGSVSTGAYEDGFKNFERIATRKSIFLV